MLNDSVQLLTYDDNLFSVEEEDALDAGAIIEVGQELMFSTALNTVTNEITVKRGLVVLLLLHIVLAI